MALGCFGELAKTPALHSLPAPRLLSLLKDDELEVENEAEVFGAVVRWARAQTPRADPSAARPLSTAVRYTLLERVFFQEVVMKEPLPDTLPPTNSRAGLPRRATCHSSSCRLAIGSAKRKSKSRTHTQHLRK